MDLPKVNDWIVVSDLEYFEGPDGKLYTLVDSIHKTEEEALLAANSDFPLPESGFALIEIDPAEYVGMHVGPLSKNDLTKFQIFNDKLYLYSGLKRDLYRPV